MKDFFRCYYSKHYSSPTLQKRKELYKTEGTDREHMKGKTDMKCLHTLAHIRQGAGIVLER